MCVTCGCSEGSETTLTNLATGETEALGDHLGDHLGDNAAPLTHSHVLADGRVVTHSHGPYQGESQPELALAQGHPSPPALDSALNQPLPEANLGLSAPPLTLHHTALEINVLAKNDRLAAQNRGWFEGHNVLALNLVSSPGAGKTTLLTRTLSDMKDRLCFSVIEGDQATAHDAERIRATGCPVVQVNTGTGCHLEAEMIQRGIHSLNPAPSSVLMIENVGNLVCPALFDLGEKAKVAILSVTEGDDKPIKYPHMFRASTLMVLNKIDLLPYVTFDMERCIGYARQVNPDIQIILVSATSGEGLDQWYGWLLEAMQKT